MVLSTRLPGLTSNRMVAQPIRRSMLCNMLCNMSHTKQCQSNPSSTWLVANAFATSPQASSSKPAHNHDTVCTLHAIPQKSQPKSALPGARPQNKAPVGHQLCASKAGGLPLLLASAKADPEQNPEHKPFHTSTCSLPATLYC